MIEIPKRKVTAPTGKRLEICTEIAYALAGCMQKKDAAVDNYQLELHCELHCLVNGICTPKEWKWIVREVAVLKEMNELLQQKLTGDEARLADGLYELGKVRTMVFSDKKTGIWEQKPAGTRGVYFLRLKQRS